MIELITDGVALGLLLPLLLNNLMGAAPAPTPPPLQPSTDFTVSNFHGVQVLNDTTTDDD